MDVETRVIFNKLREIKDKNLMPQQVNFKLRESDREKCIIFDIKRMKSITRMILQRCLLRLLHASLQY